jgi:hypothetical protein
VLTPSLLMDGPALAILLNLARVLFGIFLGTAAVVGFALAPLDRVGRGRYGVLALAVLLPPEAFAAAIWVNATGMVLSIGSLAFDYLRRRAREEKDEAA